MQIDSESLSLAVCTCFLELPTTLYLLLAVLLMLDCLSLDVFRGPFMNFVIKIGQVGGDEGHVSILKRHFFKNINQKN